MICYPSDKDILQKQAQISQSTVLSATIVRVGSLARFDGVCWVFNLWWVFWWILTKRNRLGLHIHHVFACTVYVSMYTQARYYLFNALDLLYGINIVQHSKHQPTGGCTIHSHWKKKTIEKVEWARWILCISSSLYMLYESPNLKYAGGYVVWPLNYQCDHSSICVAN